MARIQIPFQGRWREPMLQGIKTCTSRNRCYGGVGDAFEVFGAMFQLTMVIKVCLSTVAGGLFREEGCHSPREFIDVWVSLHPRKGWDNKQEVWVHHFEKLKADGNGF